MSRASSVLVLLFLFAALVIAGCGDDDDDRGDVKVEGGTDTSRTATSGATTPETTEAAPSGPSVATINVRETDFELSPQNPRIDKTGVVTFRVRNAGNVTHALEVEGPTGEQETESIAPGESATLKVNFNRAGRFEWYCPIGDHEQRGMKGVITVGSGGSSRTEDDAGTTGTDDKGGDRGGSGGSGRGGGDDRGKDDDRGGTGGGVSGY